MKKVDTVPKILQGEEVSCQLKENTSGNSQVPSASTLTSACPWLQLSPPPTAIPANLPSLKTKSEMMSKGWMWTADRIMVTVFCGSLEASEMDC